MDLEFLKGLTFHFSVLRLQNPERDPSKTAFFRDQLCFPKSKWRIALPKSAFAGASFGGLWKHGQTLPCLDVPPQLQNFV